MRILTKFLSILFILFSAFHPQAEASVSEIVKLVGKITSFDEKNVTIKSGNKLFTFSKEDLKYPAYKVGDEVEIATTLEKPNNQKKK